MHVPKEIYWNFTIKNKLYLICSDHTKLYVICDTLLLFYIFLSGIEFNTFKKCLNYSICNNNIIMKFEFKMNIAKIVAN